MTLIKKNRCCSVFAMMPNWRHLSKKESKEGSILLCSLLQKSVSSLQRVESRKCKNVADTHNLCSHSVSVQSWCQEKFKCYSRTAHTWIMFWSPSDTEENRSKPRVSPDTHWGKTLALGFMSMYTSTPAQTSFLDKKTLSHTSRVFTSHTEI